MNKKEQIVTNQSTLPLNILLNAIISDSLSLRLSTSNNQLQYHVSYPHAACCIVVLLHITTLAITASPGGRDSHEIGPKQYNGTGKKIIITTHNKQIEYEKFVM